MADEWQALSTVSDGVTVMTSTIWNKYISNANILHNPNMCWVRATGAEPTQVMYFDIKTQNKMRYLEATMRWAGNPLLVVFNFTMRNVNLGETTTLEFYNSYNSDTLIVHGEQLNGVSGYMHGWSLTSAIAVSGIKMWTMTPPADPVDISFFVRAKVASTSAAQIEAQFTGRPGFLIMEFPK